MITTTLEWHRTAEKLPDDGILVIAADHDGDTDAVFLEGDAWRYSDATLAPAPVFWAHFPAGPEAAS
jgi:1-acyl-sn-glycerol-3-phosphate acyltransferase